MRTPTPAQAIKQAVDNATAAVRVAVPARVVSFDAATQLAEVEPLLQDYRQNDDFQIETFDLPNICNVPVVFPRGLTFPVSEGDTCQLIVNDKALDAFISNGTRGRFEDQRSHDLSDAVAIMGLRSQANRLEEFDASRVVLGEQGKPRVACGNDVQLGISHGEQAVEQVIKGTQFVTVSQTQLTAVSTALSQAASALAGLSVAAGSSLVLAPLAAGFAATGGSLATAAVQLNSWGAQMPDTLSTIVKVK